MIGKFKKLNQGGFDHVFLAVIITVFVAILGTFYVVYSRAATGDSQIVHVSSGKCLNNQKNVAAAGNPVEIYSCLDNGKDAQKWVVKNETIVNGNGYCLAAQGRSAKKYVVIQRCDGSALQSWTINSTNKTIISRPSGLCLGVEEGSLVDKALIQVKVCNGAELQKWNVITEAAAQPTITSFKASSSTVESGKTVALTWDYTGGNKCSVTPGGPTDTTAKSWTSGSLTSDTTFTLSCQQDSGPAATSTAKVTVTAVTSSKSKFGYTQNGWDTRVPVFGGADKFTYKRLYYKSFTDSLKDVQTAISQGKTPIISFKTGGYSWAQVANGSADKDLQTMIKNLNAIPGTKFVAIHHEPAKDGTDTDWANMQLHALPMIKAGATNTQVGVIGNGWWFSSGAKHLTDAELARYIPAKLIAICDVIGADTYQDVNSSEDAGVKMKNMVAWANRVGGVKALGIGEFNGMTPQAITNAMNVVKTEPLFKWAVMWESNDFESVGLRLSGDRLTAFKNSLATTKPL